MYVLLQTGRAMMNSSFGSGDGPNWLSHMMCAGNENSLTACLRVNNNKILGYAPCSKDHQAGVVCENMDEEGKRLGIVADIGT